MRKEVPTASNLVHVELPNRIVDQNSLPSTAVKPHRQVLPRTLGGSVIGSLSVLRSRARRIEFAGGRAMARAERNLRQILRILTSLGLFIQSHQVDQSLTSGVNPCSTKLIILSFKT